MRLHARLPWRELGLMATLVACKADLYAGRQQTAALGIPSYSDFRRVSDAMELHCGTLDCHGQSGRNMRLYGHYGLRLDSMDNPLDPPTTPAEYDASYWSVVALEPEALSKVVLQEAAPETLAMIRKPRGIEHHKGGTLMTEGDSLDNCIVGWLIGEYDATSCRAVIDAERPQVDGGP